MFNIEINTKDLLQKNLTINQYFFCMCLYTNNKKDLLDYESAFGHFPSKDLDDLVYRRILNRVVLDGYTSSSFSLNEEYFQTILYEQTISDWIQKWFDLWPKGVKSGGHYVRTDINACRKKMIRFMKEYPQYDADIIMKATDRYIGEKALDSYSFIKLAPHFIEKNGVSMLSGACDDVLNSRMKESTTVQGDLFGQQDL